MNLNSDQNQYTEKVTIGKLAWKTYAQYFYTGGGIFGALFFFFILISSTVFIASSDYWINIWATRENVDYLNKTSSQFNSMNMTSCGLNCTDFHMDISVYENRAKNFQIYNGILDHSFI